MGFDLRACFVICARGLCFMTAATLPLERRVAGWARDAYHKSAAVCNNDRGAGRAGRGFTEDQSPVFGAVVGGIGSHAA